MYLAEFLGIHSLTPKDIVEAVKQVVALDESDILLVVGSLVEGLGNSKSDLDLLLFTARTDVRPTSLDTIALLTHECLIDLRVVPNTVIDALLGRFRQWCLQSENARDAAAFNYEERKLLHRLSTGMALCGEARFQELQASVSAHSLGRQKFDLARYMASTVQVDIAGLYQAGDLLSVTFGAQDLLAHTADALLAGYGRINPLPKWRIRELQSLPDEWSSDMPGRPTTSTAAMTFVELHRAPEVTSTESVLQHAIRITCFSRGLFPWMERRLSGTVCPLPQLRVAPLNLAGQGEVLPCLDFDVQISFVGEHFEMWRLKDPKSVFRLSPLGYVIACLCDGGTSKSQIFKQVAMQVGTDAAASAVQEVCNVIDYGHLALETPVDEDALRSVLLRPPFSEVES